MLVSHKLSVFARNMIFLPAVEFAYIKDLGCTDALLTISYRLQMSLDTGWSIISFSSTLEVKGVRSDFKECQEGGGCEK